MADAPYFGLGDIARRPARATPDHPAVVSGETAITYGELDRRACQVANGLVAAGASRQARVGVLTRNGVEFCEILLGGLRAGVVVLPINWRLAPAEIGYILRHAGVAILFHAAEFQAAAREAAREAGVARLFQVGEGAGGSEDYAAWRAAQSAADPWLAVRPSDTAVQMYTSGTTGRPKGVELTHAGYQRALEQTQTLAWGRTDPTDIVLTPAPFFHLNGVNPVLRSLSAGATIIAPPQFDPAGLIDLIERHGVTRTTLAPAMIQACLDQPGVEARDFSGLQVINYGGSPIAEAVLRRAQAVFRCEFGQMYGLTETNGPVTFLPPEDHAPERGKLLSCGRPSRGVELKVVGAEGQALSAGEVGEILVRGDTLMKGYWRDPAATAEVMADGWFHTGDAGYLDADGYLHIHDRVKDMIVSGGENIYPAEVENGLLGHPAVLDAAVIGVPDARWGEAVKALVVLRPGEEVSAEALIAHARQRLAGYKLPKSVDFVSAIPRNAAGKILRRELRAPFWADAGRQVA